MSAIRVHAVGTAIAEPLSPLAVIGREAFYRGINKLAATVQTSRPGDPFNGEGGAVGGCRAGLSESRGALQGHGFVFVLSTPRPSVPRLLSMPEATPVTR